MRITYLAQCLQGDTVTVTIPDRTNQGTDDEDEGDTPLPTEDQDDLLVGQLPGRYGW